MIELFEQNIRTNDRQSSKGNQLKWENEGIWYMYEQNVCTLIDVNERERKVKIRNYTDKVMFRAFGTVEDPDYNDYQEFLKSRCFPESRDKMKLILKDLGLPFYDPIMIIEKTEGRMAEDDFWIRIER